MALLAVSAMAAPTDKRYDEGYDHALGGSSDNDTLKFVLWAYGHDANNSILAGYGGKFNSHMFSRIYCPPGYDCPFFGFYETVFILDTKTNELRLDSLAGGQNVYVSYEGEVLYTEPSEHVPENATTGDWTIAPPKGEGSSKILMFNQKDFCYAGRGLYADVPSLRDSSDCDGADPVELKAFNTSGRRPPYAYGIDPSRY
ncbi:hypothetical protein FKW77_002645 [Venturia effusa]|uniref:Uncharacterized protein n=1 Tax=Venturia effusa TaxID=50376 RepID=A0A517LF19_9PEZI|nr:hypothetical protein FKW77_002645 [Venturia effusa]